MCLSDVLRSVSIRNVGRKLKFKRRCLPPSAQGEATKQQLQGVQEPVDVEKARWTEDGGQWTVF